MIDLSKLSIHHIGYAVTNIELAIDIFKTMGYNIHNKITDINRKVVIVFVDKSQYLIELISPIESGSPVDNILKKNGSTPYHICYEVDNIDDFCELLGRQFRKISNKSPAPAINNSNVIFLYNKDIGIIELVENHD